MTAEPETTHDETPKPTAEETAQEGAERNFAEQVRKIAYAAAEAVHISPDDVKGFVARMVEKGELAQQDGRRLMADITERFRKAVVEPVTTATTAAQKAAGQAEGALRSFQDRLGIAPRPGETVGETAAPATEHGPSVSERINASVERMLAAMPVARAADVERLGRKIDDLSKKLDAVTARFAVEEPSAL